jgi:hypothetical protein
MQGVPEVNIRKKRPKNTVSLESRERSRRQYRPRRVRILFVGEAPPASGRFFYHADSGLYRAIRDAFVTAFPSLRSSKGKFLETFRAMGCYLLDLCGEPVDRMNLHLRRCICLGGEARLARRLRKLRPMMIVTVVRSIGSNIMTIPARTKAPELDSAWLWARNFRISWLSLPASKDS